MRSRIVLGGLMIALVAAAVACSGPPHDSGIRGIVTLGPLQPVQRVGGPPNERPYAAPIDVHVAPHGFTAVTIAYDTGIR